MDGLLKKFFAETAAGLATLDGGLARLEAIPDDVAILDGIFLTLRSIKGTLGFLKIRSGLLDLPRLETLSRATDIVLAGFRDGEVEITPAAVTAVRDALQSIKAILAGIEAAEVEPEGDDSPLIARLRELSGDVVAPPAVLPTNETPLELTHELPVEDLHWEPVEEIPAEGTRADTADESGADGAVVEITPEPHDDDPAPEPVENFPVDAAQQESPEGDSARFSLVAAVLGNARSDTPDARPTMLAGFAVVALFFGGFLGWAAIAPLESAAVAPGVVSVDTNRKTIQHLEGGIVEQIHVRDGDNVTAGQVLVSLDDTQRRAKLELLTARYAGARAMEARLIAERDGADEIRIPPDLVATRGDPKIAEFVSSQTNIFEARREARLGQTSILENRIVQFREEISGLAAQVTAQRQQLKLFAEEERGLAKLVERGIARKPRILALRRQIAAIEGGLGQNLASIARAKQSVAEARLQMLDLQNTFRNDVVDKLQEAQLKVSDLVEEIRTARDALERTLVRAPQAGVVMELRIHTAGGVIGPGDPILDLVPRDDELIIEARIDPTDIDVVRVGRSAQIRLTAYKQRTTPTLDGIVIYIAADRQTDSQSGASYYLARIKIEAPAAKLAKNQLYPGMPAEVMIKTGSRTALDYFLNPITNSFDLAFREE